MRCALSYFDSISPIIKHASFVASQSSTADGTLLLTRSRLLRLTTASRVPFCKFSLVSSFRAFRLSALCTSRLAFVILLRLYCNFVGLRNLPHPRRPLQYLRQSTLTRLLTISSAASSMLLRFWDIVRSLFCVHAWFV